HAGQHAARLGRRKGLDGLAGRETVEKGLHCRIKNGGGRDQLVQFRILSIVVRKSVHRSFPSPARRPDPTIPPEHRFASARDVATPPTGDVENAPTRNASYPFV